MNPKVRTIDQILVNLNSDIYSDNQYYTIDFYDKKFIRHQIRHMVSFLVKNLIGIYTENDLKLNLKEKQVFNNLPNDREQCPGKSLFLRNVEYYQDLKDNWINIENFIKKLSVLKNNYESIYDNFDEGGK